MGKTAVSVTFNGRYPGGVYMDMPQALKHVAASLLRDKVDEFNLDQAIELEILEWSPSDVASGPSLGHALALHLVHRHSFESLVLTVHDLEAQLGFDSAIFSYDLVDCGDPDFVLMAALVRTGKEGLVPDEVAGQLEIEIFDIVDDILAKGDDKLVSEFRRLQMMQELFGYPADARRNLLPTETIDDVDKIRSVLRELPTLAQERYREMIPDYVVGLSP